MGYTNYWTWKTPLADASKFAQWSRDVQLLLDYLQTTGRELHDRIYRFGRNQSANRSFIICGPDGEGEPLITATEVALNGDASHEEDHESFIIALQDLEAPLPFSSCKTAMNPYDLLVIAALVRFAHHYPTTRLWSDGEEEAITLGVTICRNVFGDNAVPTLISPEDE